MKKIVMMLAAVAMIATANAQDVKKMWIGGSIGLGGGNLKVKNQPLLGSNVDAKYNDFGFKVMPEIGYRFNDKWSLGLRFGVGYSKINGRLITNPSREAVNIIGIAAGLIGQLVPGGIPQEYQDGNINTKDGDKLSVFEVSVKPFVRYNIVKLGEKVTFFCDGSVGYSHAYIKALETLFIDNAKADRESAALHTNAFEIGIRPGVMIDLSCNFSLMAHFGFLGYQGAHLCRKGTDVSQWGFDFGSENLNIGALFNF